MADRSKQERDQRALDALFVSQLRRHERDEYIDVDRLPKLTKEDKEALDSLGAGFIHRLLSGNTEMSTNLPEGTSEELLCAGGMSFGMNRAAEFDDETTAAIERKRREIEARLRGKEGENE